MKIGEFAKVCNTKISVLRHYDKQNLLRPIYIDKFTGYRYYSQEQISIFFRITALKEAGFTLAEIRGLLSQLKDDADILNLFDNKKKLLLETLSNLDKARDLIIGGRKIMDVKIYEKNLSLWATYICNTEDMAEARETMENSITAQEYQRISAISRNSSENTLECQVIKLNNEIGELMENIDLPFENDESVIGKWQVVGEYAVKEDFYAQVPCKDDWDSRYPQIIYFLPQGERYWCYGWTKGKLLVETGDTSSANEYVTEEHNGEKFLFISWKSYEYRKGGKPKILVLKQLDNKPYSSKELAKKDNINMPFVNDPKVIGKWKVFDFIYSKEEFSPAGKGEAPNYFREIEFLEGGDCISIYGDEKIAGNDQQVWTKNYVLRKWNHCACEYEIRTVNGRDYLIIEWKSGDYRWGGFPTDYYVFVRE